MAWLMLSIVWKYFIFTLYYVYDVGSLRVGIDTSSKKSMLNNILFLKNHGIRHNEIQSNNVWLFEVIRILFQNKSYDY